MDRTQYLVAIREELDPEIDQNGADIKNTERYTVRYDLVTSADMIHMQQRLVDLKSDVAELTEECEALADLLQGDLSTHTPKERKSMRGELKELRGALIEAEGDLELAREGTPIVGLIRGDQPLTVYHCDPVQTDSEIIADRFAVTARTSNLREWIAPSL